MKYVCPGIITVFIIKGISIPKLGSVGCERSGHFREAKGINILNQVTLRRHGPFEKLTSQVVILLVQNTQFGVTKTGCGKETESNWLMNN